MALLLPPKTRPVGDLLDALGVAAELLPGDTVQGALVLLRVTRPGQPPRLVIVASAGLGELDREGLLAEAGEWCRCDHGQVT